MIPTRYFVHPFQRILKHKLVNKSRLVRIEHWVLINYLNYKC